VAKINFELATTKSSFDEIQLENRRLADSKEKLTNNVAELKEENIQLYGKIERLEREQILRNMEGTKGKGIVARPSVDQDSCVVWGGASVSGNTWSRGSISAEEKNRAFVPISKQRLGKVGGGLEVPFRTAESQYHIRSKKLCSSVTSFNELSSDGEGDGMSRAGMDSSAHSIPLSDNGLCTLDSFDANEPEQPEPESRRTLFNFIGGGNRPTIRETTDKFQEASISLLTRVNGKVENGAEIPDQSLPQDQKKNNVETDEMDENHAGSNPEEEDCNDDDPFSTWSERGDPKRKQPEQNWLQRGLGRKTDSINSRQSNLDEVAEDPFESCNDVHRNDEPDNIDDSENYTSFAKNTSESVESSSNGNDGDEVQDRRRFGLFRGLRGGGRR